MIFFIPKLLQIIVWILFPYLSEMSHFKLPRASFYSDELSNVDHSEAMESVLVGTEPSIFAMSVYPFCFAQETGRTHVGQLLTVVWIVGLINAFNFIDGVDGLAGGIAAISGTTLM